MTRFSSPSLGLTAALALAACGQPPTGPTIELSHTEAFTPDEISVRIVERSLTAREDVEVTYLHRWFVDGALVSDLTEDTLPSERTSKGQRWQVETTPFDGKRQGRMASASVDIINSLPEVNVSVSDNTPISTDVVRATVEFYDADNDPVELTYTWLRNGREVKEIQGTDLPPSFTRRGEIWRIRVAGHDGEAAGYPDYRDIQIQNGAPVVLEAELQPDRPFTMDALTVTVRAEDPDQDPVTFEYRWLVDGVHLSSIRGATMPAERTQRGTVVQVEVTALDDELRSAPILSNALTILNTPPGPAGVAMVPSAPTPEANIVCTIVTPPEDPDDDEMTYAIAWTLNGSPWSGPVSTTTHEGDTILAANTALDQVWGCTVTPNDGEADGPPTSASATVVSWTGPRTFTNCGKTGRDGPSSSDCSSAYRDTTLEDDELSVTAGIQAWTPPSSGTYRITAYGAQGKSPSRIGGKGAKMSGLFELAGGEPIFIAIGQQGADDGCSGGGGGATFVVDARDNPLIIAAGGGGTRSGASVDGCSGRTEELAGSGTTSSTSSCPGKGTGRGLGGAVAGSSWGSAGAGFETDGAADGGVADRVSKSWFGGLRGGGGAAAGGFGGGGSGNGSCGGGGGGGYSGGDGGYVPGGGGSFNGGASPDNEAGANEGHGYVVIDLE